MGVSDGLAVDGKGVAVAGRTSAVGSAFGVAVATGGATLGSGTVVAVGRTIVGSGAVVGSEPQAARVSRSKIATIALNLKRVTDMAFVLSRRVGYQKVQL